MILNQHREKREKKTSKTDSISRRTLNRLKVPSTERALYAKKQGTKDTIEQECTLGTKFSTFQGLFLPLHIRRRRLHMSPGENIRRDVDSEKTTVSYDTLGIQCRTQ